MSKDAYTKNMAQRSAYSDIAHGLYRVRPAEIDLQEVYLDLVGNLIASVFVADPVFDIDLFVHTAGLYYSVQGKLSLQA